MNKADIFETVNIEGKYPKTITLKLMESNKKNKTDILKRDDIEGKTS